MAVEEAIDDLVVFLGLARTRRVEQPSARAECANGRVEDAQLQRREGSELVRRAPPLDVRIAPHRTQTRTRRIDKDEIEHLVKGQGLRCVGLDDPDTSGTG